VFNLINTHSFGSCFINLSKLSLVFFVHLMMNFHPVFVELVFLVFGLTIFLDELRFCKWWWLILRLDVWMFNNLTLNLTSILSGFPIFIFLVLMPILNLTRVLRILKLMIFVKVFASCAISFFLVVEISFVSGHVIITGLPISFDILYSIVHLIIILVSKLIISFLKFPLLVSISLMPVHSSIFDIIIINRFL